MYVSSTDSQNNRWEKKKMNSIFLSILIIFACVFVIIYIVNVYKIKINLSYLYAESRAPIFKQKLVAFSIRYVPIAVILEVLWIIYCIGITNALENDLSYALYIYILIPFTIITVLTFVYFLGLPDLQKMGLKSKIQQYKVLKDYYLAGFYANSLAEFELKKGNMIEELKWNLKSLDYLVMFMNDKLTSTVNDEKIPLNDPQKRQIAFILNVIVTLLHTMQNLKNYEKMSLVTQIGLQASSRFPESLIGASITDADLEIKRLIQEIKRFHVDQTKKKE
jgi:hypothetical protein